MKKGIKIALVIGAIVFGLGVIGNSQITPKIDPPYTLIDPPYTMINLK